MTAGELAFEVAPGERLRIFEAIEHVGRNADAWKCNACNGWGLFSADEIVLP